MNTPYAFQTAFRMLLLLLPLWGQGQTGPQATLHSRFSGYAAQTFQEKLFVHLDRPLYVVGETIWLKAYLVEAGSHQAVDVSKVAYVEVLDKEGNQVAQTKLALTSGRGEGALVVPGMVASGTYTVRSYTNWMKNFSPEFYFETAVSILNPFVAGENAAVAPAPASAYDVQFFPEGGQLVRGFENRVAYRAIGKDGQGIAFSGTLLNEHNDTLVRFRPLRFGIGRFAFTPVGGSTYRVLLKDTQGNTFVYPLPTVQQEGYLMQVSDSSDQLIKISVAARLPAGTSPEVFLLAHTRLGALHTQAGTLQKGQVVFVINKSTLGEGITHLTVFDPSSRPVCERLYFRRPVHPLALEASLSQPAYTSRENVRLNLTASAGADLSVAVYLLDSLPSPEPPLIDSYLWLTSDLAGTVESPGWYFREKGPEADEALDNLMLTHGWSRFRWETLLHTARPAYPHLPEVGGHFVYGKVYNTLTGAPAGRINTFLATPDQSAKLFVAQSDSLGTIRFEVKKLFNTQEIIVQTNTRQDSTYRIELSSPFSERMSSRRWPVLSPEPSSELLTRSINMQTWNAFYPRALSRPVGVGSDSLAFFGKPSEKYFLDAYTRFPTMEEVLREYVPGVFVRKRQGRFHFMVLDRITPQGGTLSDDPLILLDGVPVFDTNKMMEFDPLKVKKLEIVSGLYYMGHLPFFGIVSYTTYKGDLAGFPLDPRALVLSYEFAQSRKEFYAPRYDTPARRTSRLPDFRNLLHWSPTLLTDERGQAKLDLYTSDQAGTYKVVVQGLAPHGAAGSTEVVFEVKPAVRQ